MLCNLPENQDELDHTEVVNKYNQGTVDTDKLDFLKHDRIEAVPGTVDT